MASPTEPTNTTIFKLLAEATRESERLLQRPTTVENVQALMLRWYIKGIIAGQKSVESKPSQQGYRDDGAKLETSRDQ